MNHDLIFHAVSKRKWPEYNKQGHFNPTRLPDKEAVIRCSGSENVREYLNKGFKGRKNLLLLVIDRFRVNNKIVRDESTGELHIHGAVNIDAILDKIRIDCNADGLFDVEFQSNK